MKKVAMIGPELYPIPPIRGGAAELWIEKACHAFQRYKPFIFSPTDPELPSQEIRGEVQYFRIRVSQIKKIFSGWCKVYLSDYEEKIASILERIGPDVIHVHNRPLLIPYFKARFAETKVIFHMHNLYRYLGQKEKPCGEFEIKADLTVGCSHFVLASERNRLARGALRQGVIQNGVDTEAFRPAWLQETPALDLRREYGLEEKKVVLYTGKIRESKGVGLLWAAMKEVFRRDLRAVLVLAGGTGFGYKRVHKKTDFSNHLQREMQDYRDRVMFLGFIPPQEIPKIYLLGDVFVAPSQLEEGLGMVFLEASASGLPVIGTRQGGIPEAVIDQKTGLLLREKDNVAELSGKIINLLEHPEYGRELGHNGRQFMVDHFAWPKVAEVTEGLYDSLFSERPGYGTFGLGG